MNYIVDYPLLLFAFSFIALWLSALTGVSLLRRWPMKEGERADLGVVQGAALTLLGLLVGFTFSMAISRYEQRKLYEEAEANAIGTEYVRVGLLPAADAANARNLLLKYLDQRILFYTTRMYTNRDQQVLGEINSKTAVLQNDMWSVVQTGGTTQPTPVMALVVAGMNDVLNSQGYTQFAWWNRIPVEAWILLAGIAIGCNLLFGYGAHRRSFLFLILPLATSLSFFLIADIDSPRGGLIRVQPQNLISLSASLNAH
jgi:hypothetical protein